MRTFGRILCQIFVVKPPTRVSVDEDMWYLREHTTMKVVRRCQVPVGLCATPVSIIRQKKAIRRAEEKKEGNGYPVSRQKKTPFDLGVRSQLHIPCREATTSRPPNLLFLFQKKIHFRAPEGTEPYVARYSIAKPSTTAFRGGFSSGKASPSAMKPKSCGGKRRVCGTRCVWGVATSVRCSLTYH